MRSYGRAGIGDFFMGTHERTEQKTSGTEAELREIVSAGTPAFDSAQVLLERSGAAKIDLAQVELATTEGPHLPLDAESGKYSAEDCEPADEIPQNDTENAPARVNRFSLLAACLALSAALGGMVGALAAYSLARPVTPVIAASSIGSEEFQLLKENLVQARVDLAALKASVDAGNRNGNAQLAKVTERIERMERNQAEPAARLSKAAENLERIARTETTGSIVPPQPIVGQRPGGAEAWVLRDVRRGTAIIEGRGGTIEVDPGDVVPGMGRVEDIRKQDGRWIVVTPKGIITSRR
jgi:hypothetical protein